MSRREINGNDFVGHLVRELGPKGDCMGYLARDAGPEADCVGCVAWEAGPEADCVGRLAWEAGQEAKGGDAIRQDRVSSPLTRAGEAGSLASGPGRAIILTFLATPRETPQNMVVLMSLHFFFVPSLGFGCFTDPFYSHQDMEIAFWTVGSGCLSALPRAPGPSKMVLPPKRRAIFRNLRCHL